jgi:hypothetical protein
MNQPPYSIRFPLVIERTRYGRRTVKRLKADNTGLHGARACAANMISLALLDRDSRPACAGTALAPLFCRIARLGMRQSALWARLFAGQIRDTDPRLAAVAAERHALVKTLALQTAA